MLLQAKSDFEIEDVGSVVGFFAGCVLVVFDLPCCLKMVGFVEGLLQLLPRKADVREMEFGLREFGTGEDEPPMTVRRDGAFSVADTIKAVPALLDEIAETASE